MACFLSVQNSLIHLLLCRFSDHFAVLPTQLSKKGLQILLLSRTEQSQYTACSFALHLDSSMKLGPLLFLTYINDPPQAAQDSTVSMYADDTSLCCQSLDKTQLDEAINSDLKQWNTWLQSNKTLNLTKTHFMLVFFIAEA